MNNDEKINAIFNEICNKNRSLEDENKTLRRINENLEQNNRILLDIINNKVNKNI